MPYKDPAQQAEYAREWVARRRAEWFADKCCAWCGSTEDLQLDHIDRTTKVSHRIWSWSQVRRDTEIAKCQVLCRPCHEEKTRLAGDNPSLVIAYRHGTRAMYRIHGCKCAICLAGHAFRMRRWRASQENAPR